MRGDVEVTYAGIAPLSGAYWRSERLVVLDDSLTRGQELDIYGEWRRVLGS